MVLLKAHFRRIANFFLFYVGWGFCLSGAVQGNLYQGPLIASAFVFYHFILERFKISELLLVFSLVLFGTALDSMFAASGLIEYKGGYPGLSWLAPLWVTSIWALFASSITASFAWLRRSNLLAAAMGFGGGFASYFAAVRVGAAHFYPDALSVSLGVAVVWAFLMPLILWWSAFLHRRFPSAPSPS